MTYNVFGGTLNLTQSVNHTWYLSFMVAVAVPVTILFVPV